MQRDEMNKFDEWNEIKKELDGSKQGYVKAGKIYWLSIGQNVGTEIYGKGGKFLRPVLVIKTIFKKAFIGVPISSKTKNKSGSLYHKFTDTNGKEQVALLAQIRLFDTKRVSNASKSDVTDGDFNAIKEKLRDFFK